MAQIPLSFWRMIHPQIGRISYSKKYVIFDKVWCCGMSTSCALKSTRKSEKERECLLMIAVLRYNVRLAVCPFQYIFPHKSVIGNIVIIWPLCLWEFCKEFWPAMTNLILTIIRLTVWYLYLYSKGRNVCKSHPEQSRMRAESTTDTRNENTSAPVLRDQGWQFTRLLILDSK